jgi:putative PIG3 family NAD(P)H quinone oxidoreductase
MNIPAEMTAIAISTPGGPEVLQPTRLPVPQPGPGEVLIRVAAAGINAPDAAQRRGSYPPPPDASPLPGLEVAGEVVGTGAGVDDLKPGMRVAALCNGGGYAEYVAVPSGQALEIPSGLSLAAAAALPETFFTVTQSLVMRAGLEAGMWVLIHGAAGGIGGAAIIISKLLGARPIAVVSNADKASYATALGAEATIDHTSEDFVARVLEITGQHGADRVVDIAGGPTLDRNISASARFGHIVLVSTQAGGTAEINAGRLMMKQLTLSGSTLRPQTRETKASIAAALGQSIWPRLAAPGVPRPRIRYVPLREAPRAHAELERRDNYGKLVLLTDWGVSLVQGSEDPADRDNPIESL